MTEEHILVTMSVGSVVPPEEVVFITGTTARKQFNGQVLDYGVIEVASHFGFAQPPSFNLPLSLEFITCMSYNHFFREEGKSCSCHQGNIAVISNEFDFNVFTIEERYALENAERIFFLVSAVRNVCGNGSPVICNVVAFRERMKFLHNGTGSHPRNL